MSYMKYITIILLLHLDIGKYFVVAFAIITMLVLLIGIVLFNHNMLLYIFSHTHNANCYPFSHLKKKMPRRSRAEQNSGKMRDGLLLRVFRCKMNQCV